MGGDDNSVVDVFLSTYYWTFHPHFHKAQNPSQSHVQAFAGWLTP